jgi:hypothetical protein
MSRGAAASACKPLKLLGSDLQHTRHEKARLLTGQFQYSCLFSVDYLGRKVAHKGLDHRMADRFFGGVGQQVLLGDISDVFALRVLGEQMVERLVLARAHLGRDRLPPFLGVVEYRIDVEHHAAERIEAVLDHLAYLVFGDQYLLHYQELSSKTAEAIFSVKIDLATSLATFSKTRKKAHKRRRQALAYRRYTKRRPHRNRHQPGRQNAPPWPCLGGYAGGLNSPKGRGDRAAHQLVRPD